MTTESSADAATLLAKFDPAHVAKLRVYHMNERTSSASAVSPADLERHSSVKHHDVTDRAAVARLLEALHHARPVPAHDQSSDVRWGMVAFGHHDERLGEAYADASTTFGVIDGTPVRYEHAEALANALRGTFGRDFANEPSDAELLKENKHDKE